MSPSKVRAYLESAIYGAVLGVLSHASKREDQKNSDEARAPTQNHSRDVKPDRPRPPSHRYSHYDHPTEEEHRTAEQFSWRYGYALNVGVAILTLIGASFAVGTYLQTKRQADIAQKALAESDRPLIYIHVDQSSRAKEGDASINISNLGTKPAIVVVAGFWNNDSGVVDYGRSLKACFRYVREILISSQTIRPDCQFIGNRDNAIRHLYGFIHYKSVTGSEWLQKIDYFFNPGDGEWYEGGGKDQNFEIRLDEQGSPVEQN